MIENFHFLRPIWLLAFLPLVALIWHLLTAKHSSRSWQAVVDPSLLPHLLSGDNSIRTSRHLYLVAAVGLLSIIALAGPVWNKLPQPVFKQQSALVIALDLSRSMDASDIKPSRLTRARHKIADILNQRKEGQTALVVYAADAFSVVPLTDNVATINALLPGLNTAMMPAQGSRADQALIQAYSLFENTGFLRGDILLVSDGLNQTESNAIETLLEDNPGFRLSLLGIGSEAGGPIPLPEGGFLKDAQGSIVIARLAIEPMRALAGKGGGSFRMLSANDEDVTGLLEAIERNPFEQDVIESNRQADVWYEQGPWLILFILPVVALVFRRGLVFVVPPLVFSILLTATPDAYAFEWNDLWENNNQQGRRQFDRGQHEKAAKLFDHAEWKGSSYYRSGAYQKALEQWQAIDSETAHYNRGNTLARLGQLEDALNAYDQTLQKNPQHSDALHNRKLVEDALKKQQQQQQDQQNKNQQPEQQAQDDQSNQQSGEAGDNSSDQSGQSEQTEQSREPGENQQADQSESQSQPDARGEPDGNGSESEQASEQSSASLEQKLSEQAAEQWLRKIPDDPGGLLRRKFLYQYKNRGEPAKEINPW